METQQNRLQHQKDLNGCGIAVLANLLNKKYDFVKRDFEKKFYTIEKGTKVFDLERYLHMKGFSYENKFFNQNKKYKSNKIEANKTSKINGSITLIVYSKKYPIGHYLLRTKVGWIDPWINYPSIDNVKAGIRKKLPGSPWYVLCPENR